MSLLHLKKEDMIESNNYYSEEVMQMISHYDIPKDKLKSYMVDMMSAEKIGLLADLWEHYSLYSFIPFETFENLDTYQLEECRIFTLQYANDLFSKKDLMRKVFRYSDEQYEISKNRRHVFRLLKEHLNDELLMHMDSLKIGFIDIKLMDTFIFYQINNPKSFNEVVYSINEEFKNKGSKFFADKRSLFIDCYPKEYYGVARNTIQLDFKYMDTACTLSRSQMLSMCIAAYKESMEETYDKEPVIKCYFANTDNLNKTIVVERQKYKDRGGKFCNQRRR